MSGLVGLVHLDGRPADRALVAALTDAMAYRGPDGQHAWARGLAGLGHALLRTVDDTDDDRQPCTLDGDVWIAADARIDDRATLVAALAARGRSVRPRATDAQLVLHAYHAWGDDCVTHLLGDYAFAIWDAARRRLLCARDPFGVKLFYYARLGDTVVFSNTLDVVRRHPAVSDRLNERAVGDFLLVGYNADLNTTSFADVQRIPPAHRLVVDASTGGTTISRYWSFPTPAPIRYRREAEYVEHFRTLLGRAVGDRLRTDRIGLYFSGGMDSTTLAAAARDVLAAAGRPDALHAVTRVIDWLVPSDERHYATLAADALRIPLQLVPLDRDRYFDRADEPQFRRPEPVDNPEMVANTELARVVAAHGRVALMGEDGDALLQPASLTMLWRAGVPWRLIADVARYLATRRRLPYVGWHLRDRLRRRSADAAAPYPAWLDADFERRNDLPARKRELSAWRPTVVHPSRPATERDLTAPLWQSFLEPLDPGVSRVHQEVRLPLLDIRLLEFVLAIPSIPWCERKELFRVSMRGVLPDTVLRRPKTAAVGYLEASHQRLAPSWRRDWMPPLSLSHYVQVRKWQESPSSSDGDANWLDLRPRLFGQWLQTIRSFVP